jgi:hypothetical protein
MLGLQFDLSLGGAVTLTGSASTLINAMRIKIGANEVINYDNPAIATDGAIIGNLGVMAQTVGGVDTCVEYGSNQILTEISLPFGLDASRSHRVNVQVTIGDVNTWCNADITPGSSEMNMIHYYGTSSEATLYGSRQDYIISNDAQRTLTVFGKTGWSMLGVFAASSTSATDAWVNFRVNNGAFRQLTVQQWRNINGNAWRSPLRYLNAESGVVTGGQFGNPTWQCGQAGIIFLDLMRLTAGAPIDMSVTAGNSGGDAYTTSLFPVWVAPIGKGTGPAPTQTAKVVQNTTQTVISE